MYAELIIGVFEALQDKLQHCLDTRKYLKAVPNRSIYIGDKTKGFKFPSIYLEPGEDNISDSTVNRQQSVFEIRIVVAMKGYANTKNLFDAIRLVGDVYDTLMLDTNRTLSDTCTLDTLSKVKWWYLPEGSNVIRWAEMIATIDFDHVVT